MHPWHLHGMPMRVVARDGYPLGAAAFTCDTLGVNPGERWDVVIDCDEPGAWAFHCHILPHAEGPDGMFGMVTALVVQEPTARGRRREVLRSPRPPWRQVRRRSRAPFRRPASLSSRPGEVDEVISWRPIRPASERSRSRWSGWAMSMSADARSRRLRPNSSATPHSVTTVRTCARVVTTPAPCRERGSDPRDRPAGGRRWQGDDRAAISSQRRAADEVHLAADTAVDRVPIESATTWPVRSTSIAELMAVIAAERADDMGVVGEVDRSHLDHRVVVDEVVQPTACPSGTRSRSCPRLRSLRAPVTTPASTRSTTASVNISVWIPRSRLSIEGDGRRGRDGADPELERGAVRNEVRDVLADPPLHVADASPVRCSYGGTSTSTARSMSSRG